VLVRRRPRLRRGPARPVHAHVRQCARGRLGGAHHGAEAGGAADTADRALRGPGTARRGLGERRRPFGLMADTPSARTKQLTLVAAILGTTVVTLDSTVVNI